MERSAHNAKDKYRNKKRVAVVMLNVLASYMLSYLGIVVCCIVRWYSSDN